jgi:UDP-N-acetylglucosamine 4,6-dehydratase
MRPFKLLLGFYWIHLEKLIIHANLMSGANRPIFSVLRYGNVINSRGSVVPLFLKQKENNCFTITHPEMTRFTLTIEQAIFFVLNCASIMIGGEVFIPKLKSYNIVQLANCIKKDAEIKIVGVRPGEKLHESMVSSTESYKTLINEDYLVVLPEIQINKNYEEKYGSNYMTLNEEYSSGKNELIDDDELIIMINK